MQYESLLIIIMIINNIYWAQKTKVSKRYTEKLKLQLTLHLKSQQNDKKDTAN